MGKTYLGSSKKIGMYLGNKKVGMYLGNLRVYPNAELVTYVVDTGVSYQEEVNIDESCLSPTTFTPTKSGWTFVGWREDTTASGTVLSDKIVESGASITLYAVFRQAVTLSYNGNGNTGGSTATQTGYRYYNNGNTVNATFTVKSNGFIKTGYSFSTWNLNSTSGTAYAAGKSITLSESATMYAAWIRDTVKITNPAVSITSQSVSGSNGTGSASASGSTFSITQNAGYGTVTVNAKTSSAFDLTGFSKCKITFSCTSGNNSGNYHYVECIASIGGKSVTFNNVGKTSGSAEITGLSSASSVNMTFVLKDCLNWNYSSTWGSTLTIDSIEFSA